MTKAEKLQILDAAIDLTYKRLALLKAEDMDSTTAEKLLDTLSSLRFEYNGLICEDNSCCEDEPERTESDTPAPTEPPTPEPEPEVKTAAETPAPGTPAKTLVEVRTILSGLADKIDLPALLAQFGAERLSAIDPAKYEDLLAAAKEAAKGA